MVTIQRANPQARKKAHAIVLIAAGCGLALLSAYSYFGTEIYRYIENHIEYLVEDSYLAFLLGVVMAAPIIAAAGYLGIYGRRATKAQTHAPTGLRGNT